MPTMIHLLPALLCLPFVSAAIFPPNSLVQMLDAKSFKTAMKENRTSLVAFVAPWCGHCQKMAPEYSRAALGLYPLVPLYAVDCDAQKNKRLCAEQDVKGFPTIKLFQRGGQLQPLEYTEPTRSASGFFYWASRRIPGDVKKLYNVGEFPDWIHEHISKPRALLLTKEKKVPLLWQVLGNKYKDQIKFASHRDRRGKSSVKLGYEAGEKKDAKVLMYAPGSIEAVRYEGINKLESLSVFFDSILDGSTDLAALAQANAKAREEEFVLDEKDIEIEQQQEAQRIALAHGGFTNLIDFEAAIKSGHGADYHDVNGYPGMMGGAPKKKDGEKKEDPIHAILKAQKSAEAAKGSSEEMPETGQVVFEAPAETATETAQDHEPTTVEDTPEAASEAAVPEPEDLPSTQSETVADRSTPSAETTRDEL